ncbi:MAG: glycosyltransferase family protein [Bacteroidales bacterium]|jgi:spore coat polysaccharide biosynthesis protein SpsF
MKVVTAIQARTSSTRLPGKVLLPLCEETLLFRMIERVRGSKLAGTIIVATSITPEDDPIEQLCLEKNILCFRGDLNDLLDRHYKLAQHYNAEAVVKIPSDCPLIDPAIIDRVIGYFLQNESSYDFVSNLHPASYPDGNDVEIMTFKALEYAWLYATRGFEREHTTPYIWENRNIFRIGNVALPNSVNYFMTHRWTIDYEEDYYFIREVFEHLFPKNPQFTFMDIMDLIETHPEIATLNKQYYGRYWYENHLNELNTIRDFKLKKEPYEA